MSHHRNKEMVFSMPRQKKKKKRLSLAIRRLTNEELTHFMQSHCATHNCPTCRKVWRAYGYDEEPEWFKNIGKEKGTGKKAVAKDIETKLLR